MDKRKLGIVAIAVACVLLICGVFYVFYENLNSGNQEELTEVEKVLVKDIEKDYPPTPREVVKLYNRIMMCYHSDEVKKNDLGKLVDQMLLLLDEDLLLVNPRDEYYNSVVEEIQQYKSMKKSIVSASVCDLNEVKYVDDIKEGTSIVEKIAYVNVDYFMNTDGEFTYTHQQFVLRRDDSGRWKIITFYEIEGDSSKDE